jgi:hypothetical protein
MTITSRKPFRFFFHLAVVEVPVSFREHVKWALQYHDRRFRRHKTFPFIAFGIEQHREALGSACVQMNWRSFERDARILSNITSSHLANAQAQEEKGEPITDPAIRMLRNHVHAIAGRVMGSNQSRYHLRSQIWSTTAQLSPPSVWITINPSDLHDPIAQIFAGEDIDLDKFILTSGPDNLKRATNIASDPYAAAKFFHFTIKTVLETLFGVRVTDYQVISEMGILGRVKAYFGAVESQGRGTLHLHMLIYLEGVPSPDKMMELLQSEEFRNRVMEYIQANFQVYVPGLESSTSIKNIPREKDLAYS